MEQQQRQKVVIVTGANKGIGYALVEKLVQQYPNYKVILTARNPTLGEEARQNLTQKYPTAKNNLFVQKLDIKNSKDQDEFFQAIRNTYGKIDILVNNAGVSAMSPGASETYEDLFGTNYHATVDLTEKLLPLLADDARVIMISSLLGQLSYQTSVYEKFLSQSLTIDQINSKLKEIKQASLTGKPEDFAKANGLYSLSKAFLNAYVRWVLALRLKPNQSVVTLHPGLCETDCNGWCKSEEIRKFGTPKTAEEGTKTALHVIGLDNQSSRQVNGSFFDDEANIIVY